MSKDVNDSVPTQEIFEADLLSMFRTAVQQTLAHVLEAEVTQLCGAASGQRSGARRDVRNGHYPRRIASSLGTLAVDVPRTRLHGAATATLGRYARRMDDIDRMITSAYVHGTSTRDMGAVTSALMGTSVDKSTVSRITRTLEQEVEALRTAPIGDDIVYLFLDATFMRARWAREVEQTAALVAYGVGLDGHRRLLGISVDLAESEASWTELLQSLIARGLRGVQLVIGDEHAGLAAAVRKLFPEAKRQRCVVHFMRNIMGKAPARLHPRLGRELSRIFASTNAADLKKRTAEFRLGLGKQLPEALQCFENGLPAATAYLHFPKTHWPRIRSTNGVERINVEIKRRTRAIGAFPDRPSCLRLVTAVVVECAKQWAYRPYLDMSDFRTADTEEEPIKLAA